MLLKKLKGLLRITSKRVKSLNKKGSISIFVGVILIVLSLTWQSWRVRILSFRNYPTETGVAQGYSNPVKIVIPKVGLDLAVFEGGIVNGIWEITNEGVVHLDKSSDPGEGGNIVIYGHNKNLLFGPIRWLSVDDGVELTTDDNKVHKYKIVEIVEVSPENIQYVLPKDTETLTLYTCTGFMDSKRHIIIAKPDVEK